MNEPVLILSGSIGAGHDTVASACAAALGSVGLASEVLDCMRLPSRLQSFGGRAVFRAMLARPGLYDAFHFSQLRAGTPITARMERAATNSIAAPLARALDARSSRLSIAVFATGAGALGEISARRPGLRTAVVLTDATAHRLWAHPGIERYVALSSLAAATLRGYLPRVDVTVITPPVRAGCYGAPGRDEARHLLGIFAAGRDGAAGCGEHDVANHPVVLLMAGAWGRAALDELAGPLLRAGFGVIALSGSNAALRRRLRRLELALPSEERRRLVVYGWTDQVPALMAASDVVVSSPGHACHEARAVRRPLVLLDVVPGHGRENLLAELAVGGAIASSPQPSEVADAVRAVLGGAAGPVPRWPVVDQRQWNGQFLAALGDLCPA